MEFKVGGYWFYAMVAPDGAKHYARANYTAINPIKSFEAYDSFCDEKGNPIDFAPSMSWKNQFNASNGGTQVTVQITFQKEGDLEKIMEMGFETGFTSAMSNLEHYLSAGFKIRQELKTSNKARVTSYLNFNGNTEEAFHFYKKVFKGEFTGNGLQRFEDIEMPAGAPPVSDAHKKLIIHAELTILGGHVLMATDAPESMGFKLNRGNNMHINVEPETREETERLFNELSAGGNVTMPLELMFWGAYFAEFSDKYGINWMLNFQPAKQE